MNFKLVFKPVAGQFQQEWAWQVVILVDKIFLDLVPCLRRLRSMLLGLMLVFPFFQRIRLWTIDCNFSWELYLFNYSHKVFNVKLGLWFELVCAANDTSRGHVFCNFAKSNFSYSSDSWTDCFRKLVQLVNVAIGPLFFKIPMNYVFERSNVPLCKCWQFSLKVLYKWIPRFYAIVPNPYVLGLFLIMLLNVSAASFAYFVFNCSTRKYLDKQSTAKRR